MNTLLNTMESIERIDFSNLGNCDDVAIATDVATKVYESLEQFGMTDVMTSFVGNSYNELFDGRPLSSVPLEEAKEGLLDAIAKGAVAIWKWIVMMVKKLIGMIKTFFKDRDGTTRKLFDQLKELDYDDGKHGSIKINVHPYDYYNTAGYHFHNIFNFVWDDDHVEPSVTEVGPFKIHMQGRRTSFVSKIEVKPENAKTTFTLKEFASSSARGNGITRLIEATEYLLKVDGFAQSVILDHNAYVKIGKKTGSDVMDRSNTTAGLYESGPDITGNEYATMVKENFAAYTTLITASTVQVDELIVAMRKVIKEAK